MHSILTLVLIASVLCHYLPSTFLEIKPRYITQRANSKDIDQPAFKILSSLMLAHEYTTLFIKILVLHVEFDLYFSIITFNESITEIHNGLHRSCNLVCTESVEMRDCPKELAGHQVLLHIVVPCILKVKFQLCGDG